MAFLPNYYESPAGVLCLLTEHYGRVGETSPHQEEVLRLCGNKNSALDEAMRRVDLPQRRRALDLGCAVGQSVFQLRRYFERAVGIDRSGPLLAEARTLQRVREASIIWAAEGFKPQSHRFRLSEDVVTDGVDFIEGELDPLPTDLGLFDFVMIEKVLECLPDPRRFLAQIPALVAPGGYFLHVSSYRWHPEFTVLEKQLGRAHEAPGQIDEILGPGMKRECRFNVPFILEKDATGFSYGVAEGLLWRKNEDRITLKLTHHHLSS